MFLRLSCLLVFLRNYHDPFNLIVLKSNFLFQDNEEIIYSAFHTYSLFEYESEITRDLIYYIVHNVNGSSVIDVSMIICGVSRLCADNDNEVERVRAREYLLAALKRAAQMSCPRNKQTVRYGLFESNVWRAEKFESGIESKAPRHVNRVRHLQPHTLIPK